MPSTSKRMSTPCSIYRNIFVKSQWGIIHVVGVTIANTKFKQEIRIGKEKIIDYLAPLILNKETDMHYADSVSSLSELRSLPSFFPLNFSVDLLCLLLYNILSFYPHVPMEYGDTWINKTNMFAIATSHHEQAAPYQYWTFPLHRKSDRESSQMILLFPWQCPRNMTWTSVYFLHQQYREVVNERVYIQINYGFDCKISACLHENREGLCSAHFLKESFLSTPPCTIT